MPHNIKYIDDIGLSVLNSFKGELLYNNLNVEGKFSGFAEAWLTIENIFMLD